MMDHNPIAETPAHLGSALSRHSQRRGLTTGLFESHFRWVICALLLLATTKSYMDRNVLASLKHTLQPILGWNDIDYGHIVAAFQLCYAFGMLLAGRMVDRLGTRSAFTIFMAVWSFAAMTYGNAPAIATFVAPAFRSLHHTWDSFPAGQGTVAGFLVVAAVMGLGQSGLFPCSIKALAEWFPKKERALATGIFNAGTNLGASITPYFVALITVRLAAAWPWAFYIVGGSGFLWLILWLSIYRRPQDHPSVSKSELAYISADPQNTATVQTKIGWFSSSLIARGFSVNLARKTVMMICALSVVPVMFAVRTNHAWVAVGLISVAAAAHQAFSANLFTLPSDMFPSRAVGSVVGIGGAAGGMGGFLIANTVGHVLQRTGSYTIPFSIASSAYLVALLWIHLLSPKLTPARLD